MDGRTDGLEKNSMAMAMAMAMANVKYALLALEDMAITI